MSKIQSVLFSRKAGWDVHNVTRWLIHHDMVPIKPMEETKNFIHVRLMDPHQFKCIRTKVVGDGIEFHIGFYDECY